MDTTIYLIRHSEPLNVQSGSVRTIEPLLLKNEKTPLSINGEKIAERYANTEEFTNLNLVYSSKKYNTKNKIAIQSENLYSAQITSKNMVLGNIQSTLINLEFINV